MKDFLGFEIKAGDWALYWSKDKDQYMFARVMFLSQNGPVCRFVHQRNGFRRQLVNRRRLLKISRSRVPDGVVEALEAVTC